MSVLRILTRGWAKARQKKESDYKSTVAIDIVDSPHQYWKEANKGSSCSVLRKPFIERDAKLFTIRSCFAAEIKEGLRRLGYDTYPNYTAIALNPAVETVDWVPQHDHVAHYNTFSIRQEFEKAFYPRDYVLDDFIWLPETDKIRLAGQEEGLWQDPYRKKAYATSQAGIKELSRKIDTAIRDSILSCDVYYLNQVPEHSLNGFTFERSTYEQNYKNMREICSLIMKHYPKKKIVVSVSPVPLRRTFTGLDVVIANMESKCTLRAVAAAISREFEQVIYWPSFELTLNRDVFKNDGRHVAREVVETIVERFVAAHAV